MPIDAVRMYNGDGNLVDVVTAPGNVQNNVESEAVPLSEPDAGVCADMAVEVPNNPMCELKTSVCKAIAKLLGLSSELREFDNVGSFAKSKNRPLPIHL